MCVLASAALSLTAHNGLAQTMAQSACRISGVVTSAGVALPGVSVVARADGGEPVATSTGLDGRFTVLTAPGGTYHLAADLSLFEPVARDITTASADCDSTLDIQMKLRKQAVPAPGTATLNSARRFQALNVRRDEAATATLDAAPTNVEADLQRLLPPGFSAESADTEAATIAGRGDATSLERGALNDRLMAIGRGLLDPATGQLAQGADVPGGPPRFGGPGVGGFGGPGGPGGRGGGPGGSFGPGGFGFGGPFGQRQAGYQGAATYSFGGSALDSPPYQLRPDVPVSQPSFTQNNFGVTIGGPLKLPGLYADTNRRSSFQANYQGSRSDNVFDRYATVPSAAMRTGDFSASRVALIDPQTGLPFPGNQIPATRMDPAALALLSSIPLPNLSGSSQNYHVSTATPSSSDNFSLRFTQNLSPVVAPPGQRGPGGRGGGFGRGGFGGPRGPGGPGGVGGRGGQQRSTTILLNGQLQVRHNDGNQPNIFSSLGSTTASTTISAPISLNIVHGRTIQNVTFNVTHASTSSTTQFSNVTNVAGDAGIQYPANVTLSPLNWGVPNAMFSGFTDLRLSPANSRADTRITSGYALNRSVGRQQLRMGGDVRFDSTTNQNNANARGSFIFTGAYTAPGAQVAGGSGADLADFLLGLPQQATLQVGGTSHLSGRSFDAYVEDNWRPSSKLTLNLGLRYELVMPYTETDGHLANLDVAPGFTAASSVTAGGTGPFTGVFPAALLNTDKNNFGPRLGVAYRLATGTVLRGGYSVTYNSGSYAAIARQLAAQPPFAETESIAATSLAPLFLQTALLSPLVSLTTNNWAVDRNYQLGNIQTWNATLTRDFHKNWTVLAGYTGTKGSSLDILRAPNRGPDGLRIPDVEAFIWESSGGHSLLNSGTLQLRRRLASGFMASGSYTLSKSMDNASSLGAGGPVVAQDDQNLGAEWAPSNFDRRHQFSSQVLWEIPLGANRRWLANGGPMAAIIGNWSISSTFTFQSGTPFTARVIGAATEVSSGTNGTLRADYNGAAIALVNPTVQQFFNTAAFSVPAAGSFGDAARNTIRGPSTHQLNGSLTRDVSVGGNRSLTIGINALNILNTVQWASIDTTLNSPTFGQVTSALPMRSLTATLRLRF